MIVERRKRGHRAFKLCHNGCRRGREPRPATHIAWLIGRPTFLCGACAKGWAAAWEEFSKIDVEGARAPAPSEGQRSEPRVRPAPPERRQAVAA